MLTITDQQLSILRGAGREDFLQRLHRHVVEVFSGPLAAILERSPGTVASLVDEVEAMGFTTEYEIARTVDFLILLQALPAETAKPIRSGLADPSRPRLARVADAETRIAVALRDMV